MKKYFKQLKAMIMVAALVFGLMLPAVPAMAATDTTTIRVTGVEEGCEVWAYPIVTLGADENSWVYGTGVESRVSDGNISADDGIYFYTNLNSTLDDPMAHDGQGVAVVDPAKVLGLAWNADDASYSVSNVEPGLYVLAANKETKEYNYNFMIVAVNFQYDGTGVASIADDNGVINVNAKKTDDPDLLKEVVNDDGTTSKYDDAKIGDTVNFKITLTFPSYGDDWKETDDLRYVITDALSEGLTMVQESVAIGGINFNEVDKFCDATSLVTNASGFTMNLYGEDVWKYSGQSIEITYSAVVNEKAKVNFAEDENIVSIQYTTTPGTTDLSNPITDKTYHYTFGIDAPLNGTGSKTSTEVTKYGVRTTTEIDNKVLLAGAQFQLMDSNNNVLHFTNAGQYTTDTSANAYITTNENGQLVATGLSAGTYTLKETKAPLGYALDKSVYTITITPSYNAVTGELLNYTVKINGGVNGAITFTHEQLSDGSITSTDTAADVDTFGIINTPLITLPETGGAGIMVVTFIAVVMMAGFGSMFIMLKKKNSAK